MKSTHILSLAVLTLALCGCSQPEEGVSWTLAQGRKANISDIRYELHFDIPESKEESIPASEIVRFNAASRKAVVLDAKGFDLDSVIANGRACKAEIVNEHIVIPRRCVVDGENEIRIVFTAGEQSLNRRPEFLYTLLVPDRARTLFPCFDQPDLKARFTLSLSVPNGWVAVSNTTLGEPTEPLSTYLFSFVVGKFESVSSDEVTANGVPVRLYHRENDPKKLAQCKEVLKLVDQSLRYMEEYTGMDYPFAKYDLIVLPDFQYGGMEHTGATLYNDRRIFLNENPTTEELLDRASLIAHETAHMWFGDCVTMKWFNDVWTKEVFANWFAAKMVRPMFPEINHDLSDLSNYYAASYNEDRTPGSNAIQRPLDNLRNAGLIYCNIIYDKAPVVMEMLAQRLGYETFREGVRRYIHAFAYGNAEWDDLIEIFSGLADDDLDVAEWSRVWIKEKGMPVFDFVVNGKTLTVRQSDPFDKGNIWQEKVCFEVLTEDGVRCLEADFDGCRELSLDCGAGIVGIVPNSDGAAYGFFRLAEGQEECLMTRFGSASENCRMSILMTLYENARRETLDPETFLAWCCRVLPLETNSLIAGSMMSYASYIANRAGGNADYENVLQAMSSETSRSAEMRLLALRSLSGISRFHDDYLYNIWEEGGLSERDLTNLSYQLMIRFPGRYDDIKATQAARISNRDRMDAFEFIAPACSPAAEVRDSLFSVLLSSEGREIEARASTALALLNHCLRQEDAIKYIRPALDILPQVQREGDIFFPQTWCKSLLSGHSSSESREIVLGYVADNEKNLNPLLLTKVLQRL